MGQLEQLTSTVLGVRTHERPNRQKNEPPELEVQALDERTDGSQEPLRRLVKSQPENDQGDANGCHDTRERDEKTEQHGTPL